MEIPSTYEEYLALPSKIRNQLRQFSIQEDIAVIAASALTDDEFDALNSEESD